MCYKTCAQKHTNADEEHNSTYTLHEKLQMSLLKPGFCNSVIPSLKGRTEPVVSILMSTQNAVQAVYYIMLTFSRYCDNLFFPRKKEANRELIGDTDFE